MGFEKKNRLCLMEIKEVKFKDKSDGTDVVKYKYTFLDESNSPVIGYADKKLFADKIMTGDKFDATKSAEYVFEGRVWDNVLSWRLVV